MSLTGQPFKWLTIGIAIVATIAVIFMWNRVRGPRPVRFASRAALLAAGYFATAIAVLVSVNIAYGGLVASWSDLIDNLMPAQNTWQHNHYHHHRPPAVWAGHRLAHPGHSPPAASASRESSCVTSIPRAAEDVCAHLLPSTVSRHSFDVINVRTAPSSRTVRYAST